MRDFIDKLDISESLAEKLDLLRVVPTQIENNFDLFFNSTKPLTFSEMKELLDATKEIPFDITYKNVFVNLEDDLVTVHDIYYVIKNFNDIFKTGISNCSFLIEEVDHSFIIKTDKYRSYKKFIEIKPILETLLKNFSLIKKDLEITNDNNEFNFDELKKENIYTDKNILKETQKVRDGYKQINPLKNVEANSKTYFEGIAFSIENKNTKTGKSVFDVKIGKGDKAITCVKWLEKGAITPDIKIGDYVRVYGKYSYNGYKKEFQLSLDSFTKINEKDIIKIPLDKSETKRIEIHTHTKMSQMDGVTTAVDFIKRAKKWGWKGISFTDYNSVQEFPEIQRYLKNDKDFKVIYGTELSVVDDVNNKLVINPHGQDLTTSEYVFFDLETTGLNAKFNEIIEFGAIKWSEGNIVAREHFFIKPKKPIPELIKRITKIGEKELESAIEFEEALPRIRKFFGDSILVAHNASFDYSFINSGYKKLFNEKLNNTVICTMKISWLVNKHLKLSHKLGVIARSMNIHFADDAAHRADYDAEVLSEIYQNMLDKLLEIGVRTSDDLANQIDNVSDYFFGNNVLVYAKNQDGMKRLYEIISDASTKYFNSKKSRPTYPLSKLIENRDDIYLVSPIEGGIIREVVLNDSDDIEKYFSYFDGIELKPISTYKFAEDDAIKDDKKAVKEMSILINELAIKYGKLPIASSDPYYLNKDDKEIRAVYILTKGLGGRFHRLYSFSNVLYEKPDAELSSTDELVTRMKEIFDINTAKKLTIDNSLKFMENFDYIKPLKEKLYPPKIDKVDDKFNDLILSNLSSKYGSSPEDFVKDRLDKEIGSIIKNKYSIIYYLSSIAVKFSLDNGYLVGSRGSVGSSIAATLSNITEVNPLAPHYICPKCHYHELVSGVDSGYDLPDKNCPKCNSLMIGDGHNIPFETFLGFDGDKIPDIDLNFSGDFQPIVHNFVRDIMGPKNVFRAGTISTVAQRTAYGYMLNYYDKVGTIEQPPSTTIEYMASRVNGTKRTTGQHPGGIIIVPNDMSINDFTPINYPSNDDASDWMTTHFDFQSIHDNLLKLDLLGHIDPTAIKFLQDLTDVDPITIPMNDKKVLSLFLSNEALGIIDDTLVDDKLGIIGLPEFGTKFVRDLVREAKPNSFADLIRISGLSHGTNVWSDNAQSIIKSGVAKLNEVICIRDDIMTYLISCGVDNLEAFTIMESVRKGGGLKKVWEDSMKSHKVPAWYIDSCKKIKYMFPKAHATAYVIMAYRIAWWKIYYPLEYYSTFFSKRDCEWELDILASGSLEAKSKYVSLSKMNSYLLSEKERTLFQTLEVVLEFYSRGYLFNKVDINASLAADWKIDRENNSLYPALIAIPGLGDIVAKKIIHERDKRPFSSVKDFTERTSVGKVLLTELERVGAFNTMEQQAEEEDNQKRFF